MKNIFFENKGPFNSNDLFPDIKIPNRKIQDVSTLENAKINYLTFFDSIKYKDEAKKTKASFCLTNNMLFKYLPKPCIPILTKENILFKVSKILKKFYPDADIDYPDKTLKEAIKEDFVDVRFGNKVLVGKDVKIGKNSIIGSNTIIEHNVNIGNNCILGSNLVLRNCILGNKVVIQDGCTIGGKGFGFIPINGENFKIPHIGKVIIKDNVEIANSCTIDRGSVDDTVIGDNTYLDNQVHIAHNVKIGKNCMIAGQVGFAGSSKIGNKVSIGGQAGVSGHLKIGDNVRIGGGSGVIRNVDDNKTIMGYPATDMKNFLKK